MYFKNVFHLICLGQNTRCFWLIYDNKDCYVGYYIPTKCFSSKFVHLHEAVWRKSGADLFLQAAAAILLGENATSDLQPVRKCFYMSFKLYFLPQVSVRC